MNRLVQTLVHALLLLVVLPTPVRAAEVALAAGDHVAIALEAVPAPAEPATRIAPGDTLAFAYHFGLHDFKSGRKYTLVPGDEVYLEFKYSPELSQLYLRQEDNKVAVLSRAHIVQPDGTLALLDAPPLRVVDKSTTEVAQALSEIYDDVLVNSTVSVRVEAMYMHQQRLRELFQLMEDRPVSFMTAPVPPDGVIGLPLLPDVAVAGQTIAEASRAITARYHELGYPNTTVTVRFEALGAARPGERLLRGENPLHRIISSDGRLDLPLASGLEAAGRTPAELAEAINAAWEEVGLRARVWRDAPAPPQARILGAVAHPGVYPLEPPVDLWALIARAGGFSTSAFPTPSVRVRDLATGEDLGLFDYAAFLSEGDPAQNPVLGADVLIQVGP